MGKNVNSFTDMRIEINGKDIHGSYQHFFLQCYLQLLTSMGSDSLEKWKASCYYDDKSLTQVAPAAGSGFDRSSIHHPSGFFLF